MSEKFSGISQDYASYSVPKKFCKIIDEILRISP